MPVPYNRFSHKGLCGQSKCFWLGDLSVSRYGARNLITLPFLRSSIGASGPIFLSQETRVIVLEVAGGCFRYIYLFTLKIPVHLNG